MTFLAPGFFLASLGIAAAIVALHFIVTRQPRAGILPTARFVPDMPANATARATRPSDLMLMLLRILLVLAAGAALAKPVIRNSRAAEARIILADVSRSVSDSAALRDSVRALYRSNDALILFDSSTREIAAGAADSIGSLKASSGRGNMSAAIVAALRAASRLRDRADSVELVIVSPFAAEEMDAATDSVRALWPGRVRLVNVAAPVDRARSVNVIEALGTAGDPFLVTASLARGVNGASALVIRDDNPTANREAPIDRALVLWPVMGRPKGAVPRVRVDTIGGVVSDSAVVVSALARRWMFPADSIGSGQVVGRWIDGEPAAIEWPAGDGCIRSVAIDVPLGGDLAIRYDFVRFAAVLTGDCANRRAVRPAGAQTLKVLAGSGSLAAREKFQAQGDVRSALAPYLMALAIAAAIAELFFRRRKNEASVRALSTRQSREKAA